MANSVSKFNLWALPVQCLWP